MSAHIPKIYHIDPVILGYLDSSREEREEIELKPTDSKIQQITAAQLEEVKKLRRRAQVEAKLNAITGSTPNLHSRVTKEEAKQFKDTVMKRNPVTQEAELGSLTKLIGLGGKEVEIPDEQKKETIDFMSERDAEWKDELLPNGKELFGGEKCAIWFCTTDAYLLVNGTLSNDHTSLSQFLTMLTNDPEAVSSQKFLKECQKEVPLIARTALSGISKLPSYKGTLYRGDAVETARLEEWKKGKILMTEKLLSCTANEHVAEDFSKTSAIAYILHTGHEYKPVLYVIGSESAKSIKAYAKWQAEDEYLYPPGQILRAVEVDETTVPGLAIIYLEEVH